MTHAAVTENLAERLQELGGIDADRVRSSPSPGTATLDDLVHANDHSGPLCELIDNMLVEKSVGFETSFVAATITMYSLITRSYIALIVCITLGCRPSMDTASESSLDQASLLVVSGSQLRTFVQENELPVLVEFGVDFNCTRCQQVKPDVVALSERLDQRIKVVRVDFNANASLVAQLGGTICPRRILERHGQNSHRIRQAV